jgi:hypothetical protein
MNQTTQRNKSTNKKINQNNKQNDANSATSWLGWAVSINSVGSFAASPLFGAWAG